MRDPVTVWTEFRRTGLVHSHCSRDLGTTAYRIPTRPGQTPDRARPYPARPTLRVYRKNRVNRKKLLIRVIPSILGTSFQFAIRVSTSGWCNCRRSWSKFGRAFVACVTLAPPVTILCPIRDSVEGDAFGRSGEVRNFSDGGKLAFRWRDWILLGDALPGMGVVMRCRGLVIWC